MQMHIYSSKKLIEQIINILRMIYIFIIIHNGIVDAARVQ